MMYGAWQMSSKKQIDLNPNGLRTSTSSREIGSYVNCRVLAPQLNETRLKLW